MVTSEQITIAVTVYSRREFLLGAVRSAVGQTAPVKVIVVEDCGPDQGLQKLVWDEFGNRIEYFRNPRRRGLFDNWNACLEYCGTRWLSILHDDDLLRPNFIETMQDLAGQASGRALYFGRAGILHETGMVTPAPPFKCGSQNWREIDAVELAQTCFLMFPGQLFDVERARAIGGFRSNSYLTGDWDFWFRLALRFGGAQSTKEVSLARSHLGFDRGSSTVNRKGWSYALENVQRKRNFRMLRELKGIDIRLERTKLLKIQPVPSRLMLRYAAGFSQRILNYNAWLFIHSKPPHMGYALLQWAVRYGGPAILLFFSRVWNRCHSDQSGNPVRQRGCA